MKKFMVSVMEFLSNTYVRESALRIEEWQKNAVMNRLLRELKDANEELVKWINSKCMAEQLIERDNNGTGLWKHDPKDVQERWKAFHLECLDRYNEGVEATLARIQKIESKLTKF